MEMYYEQNVVNNNIDERIKKTKTLTIARTICFMLGLFILISSAVMITFFWVFLLLAIPFFIGALFLGHINKRNNTEYDYVLDDENLRISEIYYRQRRKLKHTIRLRNIESVGVFDSEGYKKIERTAAKKILALVNYEDEENVVYVLFRTDKGLKIIFIEPDLGFIMALRKVVSALTVFDKSISDYEKRLHKKAEEEQLLAVNQNDDDDDDEVSEDEISDEDSAIEEVSSDEKCEDDNNNDDGEAEKNDLS